MKKIWLVVAIVVVAGVFNFIPQTGEFNEPKGALGPTVAYEARLDVPSMCNMMGVSVTSEYRGWPLVAYGPYDECWRARSTYVGSIIINSLIAAGGVTAGWFGVKWLRRIGK